MAPASLRTRDPVDALSKIIDHTTTEHQRELLLEQAALILEVSQQSVPQASDRADVERAYDDVVVARTEIGRAADAGSARA